MAKRERRLSKDRKKRSERGGKPGSKRGATKKRPTKKKR